MNLFLRYLGNLRVLERALTGSLCINRVLLNGFHDHSHHIHKEKCNDRTKRGCFILLSRRNKPPVAKKFKQTASASQVICSVFWDRTGMLLMNWINVS